MAIALRTFRAWALAFAVAGCASAQDEQPPAACDTETMTTFWRVPRSAARPQPAPLLENSFTQTTNSAPDGDGPSSVVVTPDGAYALVANHTTNNIFVIELAFLTTVAVIPTPEYPEHIAVTPDGAYALTADAYNNTVSIYDLESFTLVTTVQSIGSYPYRLAISADSQTAVVGCINDAVTSSFTVIDIPTRSVRRAFSSTSQGVIGSYFTFESGQSGYLYSQFALTPDGSRIISLDRLNSRVMVYSTATGAQLAAIPCPQFPTAIRISADGTRAAITHESGINQISSLNLSTLTLTSFPTGTLVNQALCVTNNGAEAVTLQTPSNIVFTNLSTGATTGSVTIPTLPQDLALALGGTRVFASGNDAAVVNVATRSLITTLQAGVGYQAATSAYGTTAVALNNRYREELIAYDLDPSATRSLGITSTGSPPESDSPRALALTPDGHTIIAANNISDNACIWDLTNPDVLTLADVGRRPLDVACRPDGLQAAVVAADDNRLTFISLDHDVNFGEVQLQVTVPARPCRVVYSKDGTKAFVLCIDDKLVVAVDTATGAILNTNGAGTPRVSFYVSYLQFPSMTVSPDGKYLAVCDAGTSGGRVRFFNTADLSLAGMAPSGAYPMQTVFSPDSSTAYVASYAAAAVSVIRVTGGPIARLALIPTFGGPTALTLDNDGYLYVACYDPNDPGLSVIDTATSTNVLDLPLDGFSPRALAYTPACSQLFLAAESADTDRLFRVHADGPNTSIIDSFPLSWSASDVKFSRSRNVAIAAQPVFDTLDLFTFEPTVDLNHDGVVDLNDFFFFLSAFDSSDPGADLDDDGQVDLNDYFLFLSGFDTGCQ